MKKIHKIGIATSASNIIGSEKRFDRAISILRKLNYDIVVGPLAKKQYYYAAGIISQRANEINNLIYSDVDAIMFSIGGLTSVSLLDKIDYEYLKNCEKQFIGNSDITAILLAVYTLTEKPVIYAQTLLPCFGEEGWALEENIKYFKDILECNSKYRYHMPKVWTDEWKNWLNFSEEKIKRKNKWIVYNKGYASGKLIGGNLQTLIKLLGSKYFPKLDKSILFLEDTSVNAEMTESAVYTLKNSGAIDNIAGLIIGKCENYSSQEMQEGYGEWVSKLIAKKDIPILLDFDCGHTFPCMPLIIGEEYFLDCTNEKNPIVELQINKS